MTPALIRTLLTAILTLWLATSALADFNEGFAAYQRDDYATAFEEWLPIAEQGHAAAQKYLGTMYEFGQGVSQDYAEAVKWYRLAAEQGIAFAQYNLGGMYRKGRGVPQDNAEAVKWWRLVAEQGHDDAQYNLGGMYLNGKGVPQDDAICTRICSKPVRVIYGVDGRFCYPRRYPEAINALAVSC